MVKILLRVLGLGWLALAVATGVGARERVVESASDGHVLAVVPSDPAAGLGPPVTILHDYGSAVLVRFWGQIPPDLANSVHRLPQGDTVSYRGWSGAVGGLENESCPSQGWFIVNLVGPMDHRWREAFERAGLEIVAPAYPYALVVIADAESLERALQLETTEGVRVIRGSRRLPLDARIHRSLASALAGDHSAVDLELSVFARAVGTGASKGVEFRRSPVHLSGGDLLRLLEEHPEIAYVEPVFSPEPHNNLAAQPGLMSVAPIWDLGYNGTGVVVSHNDTGVDLEHPDLINAVVASYGRMEYADTAHGTHTVGSIAGRGVSPAPKNVSGCGDLTQGLPAAAGMAWGSTIITNNIFEDGHDSVDAMMAWAVDNGAHLSSNSWGLIGQTGPEVGYSSAAVQADAAVRDADPESPGFQPISIFFSAGNTGPAPGTITAPGTAKNVLTIGAVENDRCGEWVPGHQIGPDPEIVLTGSGRGPSQGRLKPDLVAPGSDVLSLESGDPYAIQFWDQDWTGSELALNTGTSQACALAAGAGAVLHEAMWRNRGRRPSPALLKAVLIAAADGGGGGVDFGRGWGRLDLESATRGPVEGTGVFLDQDETSNLGTGMSWSREVVVRSSASPLALAVVWTDPPGEEDAEHPLVNDLDLMVTAPSGTAFRGNVLSGRWSTPDPGADRDSDNNVEVIRVENPEAGSWLVRVVAVDVPRHPVGLTGQDFALAVVGDAAPCVEAPPPPVAVQAENLGANRIRVLWSAVSGATAYEISRSEVSGGQPYLPLATVEAGTESWVDTDVSGGSEYHYVVRAYRSCWSEYSDEASAVSTGECLMTPAFLGLSSVDDPPHAGCSLELSWAPAEARCSGLVGYTIYRGDEPGFEPGAGNRLVDSSTDTQWRDESLESGRDYYYVVRAWHDGQTDDDGNTTEIGGRPTGPEDVFLEDDAENGIDEWLRETGSPADTGTEPWGVTDDDAWDGEAAFFVSDEDRVKDQVFEMVEPIFLPADSTPVLDFAHRFRLHKGRDGGRLEYSTTGGLVWHDILEGGGQTVPDDRQRWQTGGYTDTIGAPTNPLFGTEGWTGDSRGWIHSRVDLADFAGRWLLLRWRFGCDDTPGAGWGWWLDGIRLVVEHECLPCRVSGPATNLVARPSFDGVELEWDAQSIGHLYRIRRSDGPDGPFRDLAGLIGAPVTTYLDSTASGGADYTYAIEVRHNGCWTDQSPGVTVTAGGPCKLAPLFWGLDAVIDRREPGCALDLEWRPGAPGCAGAGVSYRIYRSSTVDPAPVRLVADNVAGPRFRDHTIADSVSYIYGVRAVDSVSLAEDANPVIHSGWTTGPQEVHFSDSVEGDLTEWFTALGSSADSGTEPWVVDDDNAHSGSRSWFCRNEPRIKDQVVGLTPEFEITDPTTELGFHHLFDLEPFWDGGRLEFSTDIGATWHDVLAGDGGAIPANPSRIVRGAYTGFVSVGTGHPFGGEKAWTGFVDDWYETVVDLADFVGLTVQFRWRLGCDRSDARVGWWLDDVVLRTTSSCQTLELPEPREPQGRLP